MTRDEIVKLCDDVLGGLKRSEGDLIAVFNLADSVKRNVLKGIFPDDLTIGKLYGYSFLANGFPNDKKPNSLV